MTTWRELRSGETPPPTLKVSGETLNAKEALAGIFVVASEGVVRDSDGDRHRLAKGEKIKVLEDDRYQDAEWACIVEDLSVRIGSQDLALLKGLRVAVLEPDYEDQLRG